MAEELIIGIDIGTTAVKAVAFRDNGSIVASAQNATGFVIPVAGWAETDMDGLWSLCARTLRTLAGKLGGGQDIRALGISGYMGGAWLLDADRRPVRPGVLWNDGRAVDLLSLWRRDGLIDEIFRASCNAPNPGFKIPVLRWLQENEPESLERARVDLFAKDWIRFRLTGEIATEESDSSHAPGDARARDFSPKLMELCGVGRQTRLLPGVLESGAIGGRVSRAAAAETGLSVGTPVVAGLADVSSALTGAGAVAPGIACSIVGTSCLNNVVTAEPVFEPHGVGLCFLVPGGLWTRTMPNQTGALAFEWFKRELLGKDMSDRELDDAVAGVPRGAGGLLFHPYLNSTGVLAPIYEPRARARFWGLSVEHTRWHMLRAVYEGIALSMADCFQHLPAADDPVRLVGGATRSAVWRQMFADATGRPMVLVESREPGALGVAMLAGVAVGIWGTLHEAVEACCGLGAVIEPDPAAHADYKKALALYQRLRRDLVEEQELKSSL
jgi:sugar (pentulose or hexulose) kinase